MRQIFLDHQSTTPLLPEVFESMTPFFVDRFGSPSSLHQHGFRARDALAKARSQIAALIQAGAPEEIIFTANGTEAANLAVKGTAYANQRRGRHVVLTEIEHPAILHSVEFLESQGFTATRVKPGAEGRIDPESVRSALTEGTVLICIHQVNHDLGVIQPVAEIGRIAGERGIPLFVDASAAAGWLPIDVEALNASLLSCSPHRFYGPKGAGVLYRNRRARLASLIHGGIQEEGRRAGMENVPAIAGAGTAAEIARRELPARMEQTFRLQQRLWAGLKLRVPYIRLNGPPPGPERISTHLNVSAEFIEGEALALALDMHGIAIAAGPSCVSKSIKISHVLSAIGLEPELARASVICSLGQSNTEEEMDYVLDTFEKTIHKLRAMSPLWDDFTQGLIGSVIHPGSRPPGLSTQPDAVAPTGPAKRDRIF